MLGRCASFKGLFIAEETGSEVAIDRRVKKLQLIVVVAFRNQNGRRDIRSAFASILLRTSHTKESIDFPIRSDFSFHDYIL